MVCLYRSLQELDSGAISIERGSVTFVPITNPLAHQLKRRFGDRNLNRNMAPSAIPQDFEDRIANVLCPLLDAHDVLLDLHSFHTGGAPFVMIGPQNNLGALEPFALAAEEMQLALHTGAPRIVEGWLDTYARGVQRRAANAEAANTRWVVVLAAFECDCIAAPGAHVFGAADAVVGVGNQRL